MEIRGVDTKRLVDDLSKEDLEVIRKVKNKDSEESSDESEETVKIFGKEFKKRTVIWVSVAAGVVLALILLMISTKRSHNR